MCGLVGCFGKITNKHEKAFKTLLVLDSLRGDHSTGVATVDNEHSVSVLKTVGGPYELFEDKRFDKMMWRTNRVLMGHNRYATQGKVIARNAHPFELNTLVGAHNGTLHNKYKLEDHTQFDVDSENLYHHMEKKGLPDLLNTMRGAWALTWWDKDKNTMNFLRNEERPLFMTKIDDVVFWASERWMLEVAAERAELMISDHIFFMEKDTHLSFTVEKNGDFAKPVATYSPCTAPDPVVQHQHNWKGRQGFPKAVTHSTQPQVTAITQAANQSTVETTTSSSSGTDLGKTNNIIEITRKVIEDVKKGSALPSGFVQGYQGSEGVEFEVVGSGIDANGNDYLVLVDEEYPEACVRLYLKRSDDKHTLMKKKIMGNVHDRFFSTNYGSGFYKVKHSDFMVIEEGPPKEFVPDHNGVLIPLSQWEEQYGKCDFCGVDCQPGDGSIFTTAGQILCKGCNEDGEISQYVNLGNKTVN